MTYETLLFVRNVLTQLSLRVAEPDFRTTALSMIAALDELDKEIANADNPQ
jgi:hypothetical protein